VINEERIMNEYVLIDTHTYIHTHIHTYIHTDTHTHTHTYMHVCNVTSSKTETES
jgi:hypothetical protein